MTEENISKRILELSESSIREMHNLCEEYNGINLSQGSPDFPIHKKIKDAAIKAMQEGHNQYTSTWGIQELLDNIAIKLKEFNKIKADSKNEITVTCGSSEAVASSIISLVEKDDEVIIMEPFYENYLPDTIIAQGKPRYIELKPMKFTINEEELKSIFNSKTKVIIINTPNNPTGKIFSENELKIIADLCEDFNVTAITDEIYEYITYDNNKHVSLASIGNMFNRTVTISGFSKTYNMTGWRIGYAVAEKKLTENIRKVHEFLTVCPPSPLQYGALEGLKLPKIYYELLSRTYQSKKNLFLKMLIDIGFKCFEPQGSCFIWAEYSKLSKLNGVEFAKYLIKEIGVAGVPGSSFYSDNKSDKKWIRFSFPKSDKMLTEAGKRLLKLKQ